MLSRWSSETSIRRKPSPMPAKYGKKGMLRSVERPGPAAPATISSGKTTQIAAGRAPHREHREHEHGSGHVVVAPDVAVEEGVEVGHLEEERPVVGGRRDVRPRALPAAAGPTGAASRRKHRVFDRGVRRQHRVKPNSAARARRVAVRGRERLGADEHGGEVDAVGRGTRYTRMCHGGPRRRAR